MERKQMLQVLVPAAAAAGVVLLVGVLIALSDFGTAAPTGKITDGGGGGTGTPPFPVDAPEWKAVADPAYPGLKFWDVKEGSGDEAKPGATVTIHYTGWTLDGSEFDSSLRTGKPATFPLADLVQGWQGGIPGMKPGGVRRLYIPYPLAYGAQGRPPSIPPKADLMFEIKLISSR